MINLNTFPRKNHLTYTVIPRKYEIYLRKALQLSHVTDCKIRNCKRISDPTSGLEDIKNHIPDWFTPKHSIVISYFDPNYLLVKSEEISYDEDIKNAMEQEDVDAKKNYEKY